MASRHRHRYTIVGIDPGTTLGLAMLDLEGKPIEVFSSKNYSISDAIRRIISYGTPLIVASDVTPTPSMVKKISKVFSSHIHELSESLSTEEKIALTKGEGYEYRNVHERDALAACLYAFKRYKKKFAQVRKKTPPDVDVEEVKALVIKGVSISAAINSLVHSDSEEVGEHDVCGERGDEDENRINSTNSEILRLRGVIKAREREIEAMREYNAALRSELEAKEHEIQGLRTRMETIRSMSHRELEETEEIKRRDKEIKRLKNEIRAKEAENEELRRIIEELKWGKEINNGERIKVIKSFNRDVIQEVDKRYGFKRGEVVYLENGSGGGANTAELLARKGVSVVIYGKEMSHFAVEKFFEFGIPTFSTNDIPVMVRGDFAFIDARMLNELVREWRSERGKRRDEKRIILSSI
ncbi:MAG: DUF460 domain-containing protein [Methanophagales archaeon]|nr:DUF460 domain-containing protein [Methanophagales archaeon]MCW3139480.1 DUF460 domain-containing protein [Methanophagales archaeon]MCW7070429.1 DUF460 domain-containing protein [Methanophagales archaeon]